jgi:hypothetical protein
MGLIFPNQDVDTVWQRKTKISTCVKSKKLV